MTITMTSIHRSALCAALLLPLVLSGCVSESVLADKSPVEDPSPPGDGVLAVVNGVEVTREAVEAEVRSQLLGLDRQRHDLIAQGLGELIDQRLLEAESGERGVTREELLQVEVADKIDPVGDEEVDAFYQENQERISQPKEQVAEQIRSYLEVLRKQQREAALLAELREKYRVRTYLEPMRLDVEVAGSPSTGPEDAPVTIIEFSDFECPYCSRLAPTLDRVREEYGEKVRLVFRQFPLHNIHPNAQKAAEASLCAHEQGRFWEMHDTMFREQRALGVEQLKQKAARLELDTESFNECLDSNRYAEKVDLDLQAGVAAGVTGTPAMFINGRFLGGAQPFEAIAEVIDEELAAAGG
ncbi:MAG: thioredoxin domain-containing protein [Thermoanaerobaculia bacterium]|nr:thioredoxin domain-containing protein [Thermoanaerobaculia bacterium]